MIGSHNKSEELSHIDFLIITALPDEQEALLDALGEYKAINFGDLGIGTLHHIQSKTGDVYDVVLVTLSRMGNVESGIQSTLAINALQPNYLILAGIAGGIKGRTSKGDILVADQIIYYSQSKRTPDGNDIRPQGLTVDPYLLQVAKTCWDIDWGQLRAEDHFQQNSPTPNIHFGPILVGEEVVADTDYLRQLLKLSPKIIGVEMESYGVGRAALFPRQRIRFITFRGVSDFADEAKDDSWHKTACVAVAAYTASFIKSGLVEKVPGKPRKVGGDNIILHHFSQQLHPQKPVIKSINAIDPDSQLFYVPLPQYQFFKDDLPIDLVAVQKANISAVRKIEKLLVKHPDATLFYFGIAHIPLLFHLGFLLSNKRRLNIFEFDRYSQIWIPLKEEGDSSSLEVEGLPSKKLKGEGDVIIRISISNTVALNDLPNTMGRPLISLHAHLKNVRRDAINSQTQLMGLGKNFRAMMDSIQEFAPNRKTTHIFYAGPVSLAVYFGQLLHAGVDRNIKVYNFSPSHSPRYSWALDIS